MVSGTILAAGAGVIGTLLGSGITAYSNYRTNAQRLKEERKRIQAEIHSERQLNALMDLYTRLDDIKETYTELEYVTRERYSDNELEALVEEYTEAVEKSDDLIKSTSEARVFLDKSTERKLIKISNIESAMQYNIIKEISKTKSTDEIERMFDAKIAEDTRAWEMSDRDVGDLADEGFSVVSEVQKRVQNRIRAPIQHVETDTETRF